MKRSTKIWLITAACLVLLGVILFIGVIATLNWDFLKLSTIKYKTNTHEITEPFDHLSLTTDTADIVFALAEDGKCSVICREEETAKHAVTVENGTLIIKIDRQKSWYENIGISFDSPTITLYLPKTEYDALSITERTGRIVIPNRFSFEDVDISLSTGDVGFCASAAQSVKVKASTGNIRVENVSVGALDLSVTTGKVTASGVTCRGDITVGISTGKATLSNISCKNVLSTGRTGNITLNHVIAAEKISVERSTGEVKFSGCDAAELSVKTTTGNVSGSLLTDKVFLTDTDTGSVEVPKTAVGGKCEIKTRTGDIKMEIK